MLTSARKKFALLALLMVSTCFVAISVMTAMLYRHTVGQHEEHLRAAAESQARLIEAVARHEAHASQYPLDDRPDRDAVATTLRQIADAHRNYGGWDETGEFTLARREGDTIVFLLSHRHDVVDEPAPVPFDSELAEPMRRALSGQYGTVIGPDYRGVEVMAAYEPVAVLNLGIVAKVDMDEVRAPFVRAGLIGGVLALLLVLTATAAFFRIGRPIVRRLEAHADLLGAVHKANPDLQFIVDAGGTITHVHRSGTNQKGGPTEERVGRRLADSFPADVGALFSTALREGSASPEPKVFEYRLPQAGDDRHYEARIAALDGGGCVVTIRDISSRKRGEAERERLMAAISQAAESIIITGTNGTIQFVNPAFERMSGYSRDQVIGERPSILKSGEHDKAFYVNLWTTILGGETWQGEIVNRHFDGSLYTENVTISPVFDGEGAIVNFVAVRRDTSHERSLEAQLRHAQKMEAIGTLTGGIAHDFNNILHSVTAYSELAQQCIGEDTEETLACLEEIDAGARRAAELVRQLLAFSRAEEVLHRVMYIGPVVEDALKLLRSTLPATIEMKLDVDAECSPVLADPTQVHQIVLNLCTNAMQAMESVGGTLCVRLARTSVEVATITSHGTLNAGEYVVLSVSDTGVGIDPENIERVFEPFFTTKEQGKGTGLGLATVHGIVGSMGGTIVPEAPPEGGTVFSVYFPRSEELPAATKVSDHGPPAGPGVEAPRVMFVDDEPSITKITKKLLARRGFDVQVFTDSAKALEAFERDPGAFSIVVTDLTMPKLTGLELASRIRGLDANIPIVLASGQIDDVMGNEDIAEVLRKPVDIQDLVAAIHRNLVEETASSGVA